MIYNFTLKCSKQDFIEYIENQMAHDHFDYTLWGLKKYDAGLHFIKCTDKYIYGKYNSSSEFESIMNFSPVNTKFLIKFKGETPEINIYFFSINIVFILLFLASIVDVIVLKDNCEMMLFLGLICVVFSWFHYKNFRSAKNELNKIFEYWNADEQKNPRKND